MLINLPYIRKRLSADSCLLTMLILVQHKVLFFNTQLYRIKFHRKLIENTANLV